MSENAQATSVAGAPAARNGGTGAAKRSGKGGRGLTVGIAVGAVLTVVGIGSGPCSSPAAWRRRP